MACRIGITTNPEERRRYWQRQHPFTFRNWQVLETHRTKTSAQEAEYQIAAIYGCIASPGGAGDEIALWHVYYFEYD